MNRKELIKAAVSNVIKGDTDAAKQQLSQAMKMIAAGLVQVKKDVPAEPKDS